MEAPHLKPLSDMDVRHFIYATFANAGVPPTTHQAAFQFNVSITEIEAAYHRLADDHQIALAPGSSTIWMAHPFSAIPTNNLVEVGGKKYWGN